MATVTNADLWANVGSQLYVLYSKAISPYRYFNTYTLNNEKNPLAGVMNQSKRFFGPKVCNILIIGKPYQEEGSGSSLTLQWPPDGYEEAKANIKESFNQWTKYELHIYIDFNIVKKMRAVDMAAGDKLNDMLRATADHLKDDCEGEMADYGWFYEEEFENEPDATAFFPVLDKFYSNTR